MVAMVLLGRIRVIRTASPSEWEGSSEMFWRPGPPCPERPGDNLQGPRHQGAAGITAPGGVHGLHEAVPVWARRRNGVSGPLLAWGGSPQLGKASIPPGGTPMVTFRRSGPD